VHSFISFFCHTSRILSSLIVSVVIQLIDLEFMINKLIYIEFVASQHRYLSIQLPVFFSMYPNSYLFVSTLIHASIYQFIATLPHPLILILIPILMLVVIFILIFIFLRTITQHEILPHFSILHYIVLYIITL
jgi:hypothetical protein